MIKSIEHLEGMVDMLIHLYKQHQGTISDLKEPSFVIEQKDNVYRVMFQWQVGSRMISKETYYSEAEYAPVYCDDWFKILKDESLTKLEQYVEDVCDNIVESNINNL